MLLSELTSGGVIGLVMNTACGVFLIAHSVFYSSGERERTGSLFAGVILLLGSLIAAVMFASS